MNLCGFRQHVDLRVSDWFRCFTRFVREQRVSGCRVYTGHRPPVLLRKSWDLGPILPMLIVACKRKSMNDIPFLNQQPSNIVSLTLLDDQSRNEISVDAILSDPSQAKEASVSLESSSVCKDKVGVDRCEVPCSRIC